MEQDLPKKIYQGRPDLILNIDNEYMTFMLMDNLRKYYANSAFDMPQRHYFNRFVRDMRQWTLKYVDYMHYTTPLKAETHDDGFTFPGEYVGQYGAYEAVRHIYAKNSNMADLLKEDSLYVSQSYFATDLEKGVERIREEWRQKNGLTDNSTVIFFAPGNEKNEAEFSTENVRKGIKEFLLKYSAPTSLSPKALSLDNFVTVISLQSGSDGEKFVRDYLRENEWYGKVIFVSDQDNAHLDAMCAADYGFVYDGQMSSSAVACHLPTVNLIKMRMHHQWFHDLFNRWQNDMNIIANNNVGPEFIGGEAWFGKIADTLGEWYVKPDTRYNMIRAWGNTVQESMSYKPIDRSQVRTRDIILARDGNAYGEYMDPMYVTAKNMWADIEKFENGDFSERAVFSRRNMEIPFNTA